MGHNFLSSSLIWCYLLTPSFGRMHNLNVNAIYIGEQSRYAVSIANNHLQGGNQLKARISSCQAEVYITCHSLLPTFLPKPPASEPQLGRYKEVENWRHFLRYFKLHLLLTEGSKEEVCFSELIRFGITIEIVNWPMSFNKYVLVIS